jgi:hypothetical protein
VVCLYSTVTTYFCVFLVRYYDVVAVVYWYIPQHPEPRVSHDFEATNHCWSPSQRKHTLCIMTVDGWILYNILNLTFPNGSRVPVGAGNFSPHHRVQTGSEAHPASYPMGSSGSFPGYKAAGAWSWPLISIVPRSIIRGAVPPLLQYAFMVWCLVKYRDNSTSALPDGGKRSASHPGRVTSRETPPVPIG